MHRRVILLILSGVAGLGLSQVGLAQLGLPQVGQTVGDTLGNTVGTVQRTVDRATDRIGDIDLERPVRSVRELARDRLARLADFARINPAQIDLDEDRQPARRGVVLLLDPDAAALDAARALGFRAEGGDRLDALGLGIAELTVPEGMGLAEALGRLRVALPGKTLTADQIHFQSGVADGLAKGSKRAPPAPIGTPVGLIDGGVGPAVPVAQGRGFAPGGPAAGDHGTAVASLLRDAGVTRIWAADVYGKAADGGSALAIAKALDWFAGAKVPVVSISLVGPRNPLLERAIAAMSARGTVIVAAVGNDGPAAPPAYPASYPAVLAVTGVDGRQRALIEAGRALHLDYAAPGADLKALDARGRDRMVRGTSFAAPFVAARAAAAIEAGRAVRPTLDAEARDLGRKGADESFGRGLVCGDCARR